MPDAAINRLTEAAAAMSGPCPVEADPARLSRIDPCGLRESNFGMMNQLCEGMNNVARHVRPFTVLGWAWRRALALASDVPAAERRTAAVKNFVMRAETIFAWSLLLADRNCDIPGSQALAPLLKSGTYRFGGSHWISMSETRWDSTGFSAPANYGPGLRNYGWLRAHSASREILVPTEHSKEALDAFEAQIASVLEHPAFRSLDEVDVTTAEAASWASAWQLSSLTQEERKHAARSIAGDLAPEGRKSGVDFLLHAASILSPQALASAEGVLAVRRAVSGDIPGFTVPGEHEDAAARWRRLQVRQLFRLALEGLLAWVLERLQARPMHGDLLARTFLHEAGVDPAAPARTAWLDRVPPDASISDAVTSLQSALKASGMPKLAAAATQGLAICLRGAPASPEAFEAPERLPIAAASRQARVLEGRPAVELARHAIETWVLAQHVYWAVGRGIQDARGRGKSLGRLQVAMEEGGWQAMPGARLRPEPTADRIRTALSLSAEAGII